MKYIVKLSKGYTELSFAFDDYAAATQFMQTSLLCFVENEDHLIVTVEVSEVMV